MREQIWIKNFLKLIAFLSVQCYCWNVIVSNAKYLAHIMKVICVCVCVLDSMWPATWLDRNQVCLAENQPKPTQKKKKKKQQQLRAQLDQLHSEAASTRAKGIIIHVPILITINFFPFYDQFDSHQYQD